MARPATDPGEYDFEHPYLEYDFEHSYLGPICLGTGLGVTTGCMQCVPLIMRADNQNEGDDPKELEIIPNATTQGRT